MDYEIQGYKASKDEYEFAIALKEKGIEYTFQPFTTTLQEGGKTSYTTYRDITYTPDFYFEVGRRQFIIEVKGFLRGDNGLKNKLADLHYTKQGYEYYVVKLMGRKKDNTQDFYYYKDKGRVKQKNKIDTFWRKVGI